MKSRRAAVLVPVRTVPETGPVMTMIRRTVGGSHSGQMAFPGGIFEPDVDQSLIDTALRESFEEVGLHAGDVEVIGALPERKTHSSQLVVSAFVARIPHPYEFSPEEREVARIVDAPVASFRDPSERRIHRWEIDGRVIEMPAVLVCGEVVWGLSLSIIDDLIRSDLVDAL